LFALGWACPEKSSFFRVKGKNNIQRKLDKSRAKKRGGEADSEADDRREFGRAGATALRGHDLRERFAKLGKELHTNFSVQHC